MAAIWVTEPMGLARLRLIASTPAMKVVVTAPMPGIKTPSFPSAGAMETCSLSGKSFTPLQFRQGAWPHIGQSAMRGEML